MSHGGDATEERVPCLWVFLPLPQPLGLPEGMTFQSERTADEILRFGARALVRYSARVLQVRRTANVFGSDALDIAQAVARAIEPEAEHKDWRVRPELIASVNDNNDSRITLLEVAVPTDADVRPDDLEAALSRAVEAARQTQASVSAVLQLPLRLLSRASLPPSVHVVRGTAHAEGMDPLFDELISYDIEDCASPSTFGLTPEPLSEEKLQVLALASDQLGRGSFLAGYVDLRREAMVQRKLDGNARLTVITTAIAAEVFLDALLLHMLWEEHTEPADAADVFDRATGHQARVLTHFPPRLGGDWDPNGTGPVGRYFSRLAYLRNRVVHTGARPDQDQAITASDVLDDLQTFCGDRLAGPAALRRYGRTAMGFLGESGLRRRDAWTQWMKRLVASDAEPKWIDAFKRYRHLVDRHAGRSPATSGREPETLELYFDLVSGGYVLRDAEALEAAPVDDVDALLTPEQLALLEATKDAVTGGDFGGPIRSRVEFDVQGLSGEESWRPEAEFFPELAMWPATKTDPP